MYLIWAERRGKHGTERRYITAPHGGLLHGGVGDRYIYATLSTLVKAGWRKAVAEELDERGDHFARQCTLTMTPPKRRAKDLVPA